MNREDSKIKAIFRELKIFDEVQTNELDFYTERGQKKVRLDEAGKKKYKTKEFFPSLHITPDGDIFLNQVRPAVEKRLYQYFHGLLVELHRAGAIENSRGELLKTGYPEKFRIKLYGDEKIKELNLLKELRWYKATEKNGISSESYPVVEIKNKNIILNSKGIGLTRSIVENGLEKFQKFYKVKLKKHFMEENEVYTFPFQTELKPIFPVKKSMIDDHLSQQIQRATLLVSTLESKRENLSVDEKRVLREVKAFLSGEYEKDSSDEVISRTLCDTDLEKRNLALEGIKDGISSEKKMSLALRIKEKEVDWERWQREVIAVMHENYQKKGNELVFLGELCDADINYQTQIHGELTSSPHMLIAGQTTSGKTKTMISIVIHFLKAYPETKTLFVDFKNGLDLDPLAQKFSDYPVAKLSDKDDIFIEVANHILYAQRENKRRKRLRDELNQETGIACPSYVEYNAAIERLKMKYSEMLKSLASEANTSQDNLSEIEACAKAKIEKIESYLKENKSEYERVKNDLSKDGSKLSFFKNYEVKKINRDDLKFFLDYPELRVKHRHLPRFLVVFDEFGEYIRELPDKAEAMLNKKGTLLNIINGLLRESRSQGFTIILSSQRTQSTDFPTPIRDNLSIRCIHSIQRESANYLGLSGKVETLSKGRFILNVPGLLCKDSGSNIFTMRMPFVSDDPQLMLKLIFGEIEDRKHESFDYDIIYNTGNSLDIKKISLGELQKFVKQSFLAREDFEVTDATNPEHKILSLFCNKTIQSHYQKIAIGFIDGSEFDDGLMHKIVEERPHDYQEYLKIIFIKGKSPYSGALRKFTKDHHNTIVLGENDYARKLNYAFSLYKDNNKDGVFTDIITKSQANDFLTNEVIQVKKSHDRFNILELKRIRDMKNNNAKGDALEKWYLELEHYLDYDTVTGQSVAQSGNMRKMFNSKKNEGGLDLLRWTNKDEKECIVIQCKNQKSKALRTEVLDKLTKTKYLYESGEDLKVVGLMLVTTGKLTRQATAEAKEMGVIVLDFVALQALLEKINT